MNIPVDITNTVIRTERLILRPWRESDLEDFFEYASVDGVGQMAGWLPHESRETSKRILDRFIEGRHVFAIEFAGKAVGSLGIEKYDEEAYPEFADKRCCELGFVLAKPCWGKALMPEAVRGALRWCFTELGLDAVFCGHFVRNAQSRRVQEKCGFKPIALVKHTTRYGTVEDTTINLITREEYFAGKQ